MDLALWHKNFLPNLPKQIICEQQQLIFRCFNHIAPKEFYELSTLSSPAIIPFKGWWRPRGLRWWWGVGNLSSRFWGQRFPPFCILSKTISSPVTPEVGIGRFQMLLGVQFPTTDSRNFRSYLEQSPQSHMLTWQVANHGHITPGSWNSNFDTKVLSF